jgi:hypothetical protein
MTEYNGSMPFWRIARDFNVPYTEVLSRVERYEALYADGRYVLASDDLGMAVWNAIIKEQERRRVVALGG